MEKYKYGDIVLKVFDLVERKGRLYRMKYGKYRKVNLSGFETALFMINPPENSGINDGAEILAADGNVNLQQLDDATIQRDVDLKNLNELYKWMGDEALAGEIYDLPGEDGSRIKVKVTQSMKIPRNKNGDPVMEENDIYEMVVPYKMKYVELSEDESNWNAAEGSGKEIWASKWVELKPNFLYNNVDEYRQAKAEEARIAAEKAAAGEVGDHLQLKYKL